eukprot:Nitzschia sp. Nitz4//scaffold19_size178191//83162//83974//NITZ4_001977-RA/size178191-processed-gene-0.18-mRNA-1//1//CDS//3329540679//2844//frame0
MADEAGDDYDAAEVMMQRGAFLRKLRMMEQQDEEERAQAGAEESPCGPHDSTLNYASFLQNQSFYDDYKHVNYRFIDFGMVNDRRLVVEQDRGLGKGGFVWDAAIVLAQHLMHQEGLKAAPPKSIIEIGAGTGVGGLLLACEYPTSKVHLTDLPQLKDLMSMNSRDIDNAVVEVLEWGKTPVVETHDIIIGADVVASIYDSDALVKTLYDLASPHSHIYLAGRDRITGTCETLEHRLQQLFHTVQRETPLSENKNPTVWILHICGKQSHQ